MYFLAFVLSSFLLLHFTGFVSVEVSLLGV